MRNVVLFLSAFSLFLGQMNAQYTEASQFTNGDFFKVSIPSEGVYKLSFDFINSFPGVDAATLSPKKIGVFGNQGGILPVPCNADRVDDIKELAIAFYGDDDDVFESNEYFIFYGEGHSKLTYDGDDDKFHWMTNPYELSNYYFISTTNGTNKRISKYNTTEPAEKTYSTYTDVQRYEADEVNLLGKNFGTQGSGQHWFGESFENTRERSFERHFDFENIVKPSKVNLEYSLSVQSVTNSYFDVELGESSSRKVIPGLNFLGSYSQFGRLANHSLSVDYVGQDLKHIKFSALATSEPYSAYLDFIQLICEKDLIASDFGRIFRQTSALGLNTVNYQIANSSPEQMVWNTTDAFEVKQPTIEFQSDKTVFSDEANSLQTYVTFHPEKITAKPTLLNQVENQNLHGIKDVDYVIIYPEIFDEQARLLAEHRGRHSNMTTLAISVNQVYNEFGGGSADPSAIRDFARFLHKTVPTFDYLCLFGDATYDYRNLDPNLPASNFVPTYQRMDPLSPVYSFSTDDYFALLSDHDGSDRLGGALDIAVGRIPVETQQEARTVVDKIINYDTNRAFNGAWKNEIVLVADDEDQNDHLEQSERLESLIASKTRNFNVNKIYFDAYEQVRTIGDDRYPDAKAAINNAVQKGALIVNYFGHGGPSGWAQERVLDVQDILGWNNATKLPLFVTATCTFTAFDDAALKSGGELTLLNPNGGTIGLISTTRAVGITPNERVVRAAFNRLVEKNSDGHYFPIGKALQLAKNANSSDTSSYPVNARKFVLIGDPALTLAIPDYNVSLIKMNGLDMEDAREDTLHALDQVHLEGTIVDVSGEVLTDYNGTIEVTLMDKAAQITTLGNDSPVTTFRAFNSVLFEGKTNVTNGKWNIAFVIPKDINYEIGTGRLSFYAHSTDDREASGYSNDFNIGGTAVNNPNDDVAPELAVYLDSRSFKDGDETGNRPTLIADVSDDLGLNLSNSAIGHEMIAVLDDEYENQTVLNGFYESNINDTKSGTITFTFDELEEGKHTLLVRVFDVANNATEQTITFNVVLGAINKISDVVVTPNPSNGGDISFSFVHRLNSSGLTYNINIYNTQGLFVSSIDGDITTASKVVDNITWNGAGFHGDRLPAGLYIYRIKASSEDADGVVQEAESEGGKIVLTN